MEFENRYLKLAIFPKMRCRIYIYIKIFLIYILSLNACKAQENENSFSLVQTSWEKYNLKGQVKELITILERNYSDTLPKNLIAQYENQNNLDYLEEIPMGRYLFSTNGFLIKQQIRYKDSTFLKTILGSSRDNQIVIFQFDSIESTYKISGHKYLPPIFNAKQILVNRKYFMERDLKKPNPEYLFKTYEYDINDNKILQERYFLTDRKLSEMNDDEARRWIHQRTINEYNEHGQIVSQRVFYDENVPSDGFRKIHIFHIKTDIPDKAKVDYKYKYDNQNRIIEVKLLINESRIWQENYFYKDKEERPFKLDRYIQSQGTYGWFLTDNATEWYTEFGDITKAVDFDDSGNDIRTRFYDYKYDDQNNWTECSLYLEGSAEKTEKPTIVAHRTITYYPESEQKESEN